MSDKRYIRRSFFMALFLFSTTVLGVVIVKPELIWKQYEPMITGTEAIPENSEWATYSDEVLAKAQTEKLPVMIDFYADWCGACHELKDKTFSTPEFKELSKQFKLVKFDATDDNEAIQKVLTKYSVKGLPTVLFINRNGVLLTDLTFTQFLEMSELRPKMQEALK